MIDRYFGYRQIIHLITQERGKEIHSLNELTHFYAPPVYIIIMHYQYIGLPKGYYTLKLFMCHLGFRLICYHAWIYDRFCLWFSLPCISLLVTGYLRV